MTFIQHAKVPTYSTNRGLSKNAIKKVVILIGSKDIVFAKSLWRTGQVYSSVSVSSRVVSPFLGDLILFVEKTAPFNLGVAGKHWPFERLFTRKRKPDVRSVCMCVYSHY